jgi:iron complex outermembrane receptor protein
MKSSRTPVAVVATLAVAGGAFAQERTIRELSPIVVTASPIGSDLVETVEPVNLLQGQGLRLRQQPTLGETVAQEPGLSSTYFGPNASRPIIRGLGAFDIRLLGNGLGLIDASAASPDHAVATSPFAAERIEVVRGPATVMYGGSAVGGVVNVIDGRIAQEGLTRPVEGAADFRYGGANDLRAGGVKVNAGNRNFVLHVDGYASKNDDLKIPGSAWTDSVRAQRGEPGPSGRLPNSHGDSQTWGAGVSFMLDGRGYAGASYSQFDSDYGTVAEPDVTIKLRRNAWNLAGELREPVPGFEALRAKYAYTDYDHTEFEGAEPGTVFKSHGYNLRLEGLHAPIARLKGAVGLELARVDFSALGDEAFVPSTTTDDIAGFVYEELPHGPWKFLFGARVASVKVEAEPFTAAGLPADSRSFTPWSGAVGTVYTFTPQWNVAANLAYTQRAPSAQELYADGPHIATNQFEVGNRNLGKVESTAVDVALRRRGPGYTGSIGAFYNNFSNYIALVPTGIFRLDDRTVVPAGTPDALEQFDYVGVKARFWGIEAQAEFPIWSRPGETLNLGLQADYVNARNRTSGAPLPFIPPLRGGATLAYRGGAWTASLGILAAAAQNKVPQFATTTPGYGNVFANVAYRFGFAGGQWLELFVQGTNLTDQTIRYSTSSLKDIAPLGGRAVMAGVRGAI